MVPMTQKQAEAEAKRRWGPAAYAVNRCSVVGCRDCTNMHEVGSHRDRIGDCGNGWGASFEEAFADADRRRRK